jgi:hypothetical protein
VVTQDHRHAESRLARIRAAKAELEADDVEHLAPMLAE